jgi:hypothetical protein
MVVSFLRFLNNEEFLGSRRLVPRIVYTPMTGGKVREKGQEGQMLGEGRVRGIGRRGGRGRIRAFRVAQLYASKQYK